MVYVQDKWYLLRIQSYYGLKPLYILCRFISSRLSHVAAVRHQHLVDGDFLRVVRRPRPHRRLLPRLEGLQNRSDQRFALRIGMNPAQEQVYSEISD